MAGIEHLRTHATLIDERRQELLNEEIVIVLNLAECTWRITPADGHGGETVTFTHPSVVRAMRVLIATMRRVGRKRQPVQSFFKPAKPSAPAGPCPECGGSGWAQDREGNWSPCERCGR